MRRHPQILCILVLLAGQAICGGPSIESRAGDQEGPFWSFQPVRAINRPSVRAKHWAQSPIDEFILAGLEERGLSPSPAADRRTLLRRVTFDLTGLPPTPEEVDA